MEEKIIHYFFKKSTYQIGRVARAVDPACSFGWWLMAGADLF
jgi:hypothetical protein